MTAGGHFFDAGVGHGRDDELVALGEAGEDGQESLLHGSCVQAGEEHDEGPARSVAVDGCGQAAGVRLDQLGFEGCQGVGQGREKIACRAALYGGAYAAVVGEQVHAVAGAGGEGAEQ